MQYVAGYVIDFETDTQLQMYFYTELSKTTHISYALLSQNMSNYFNVMSLMTRLVMTTIPTNC